MHPPTHEKDDREPTTFVGTALTAAINIPSRSSPSGHPVRSNGEGWPPRRPTFPSSVSAWFATRLLKWRCGRQLLALCARAWSHDLVGVIPSAPGRLSGPNFVRRSSRCPDTQRRSWSEILSAQNLECLNRLARSDLTETPRRRSNACERLVVRNRDVQPSLSSRARTCAPFAVLTRPRNGLSMRFCMRFEGI